MSGKEFKWADVAHYYKQKVDELGKSYSSSPPKEVFEQTATGFRSGIESVVDPKPRLRHMEDITEAEARELYILQYGAHEDATIQKPTNWGSYINYYKADRPLHGSYDSEEGQAIGMGYRPIQADRVGTGYKVGDNNMNKKGRRHRRIEPINSQGEANDVRKGLVAMTVLVAGIDDATAQARIDKLLKSGELNGLQPTDQKFQRICDDYMFGRK